MSRLIYGNSSSEVAPHPAISKKPATLYVTARGEDEAERCRFGSDRTVLGVLLSPDVARHRDEIPLVLGAGPPLSRLGNIGTHKTCNV
jgi:hypothetical protein